MNNDLFILYTTKKIISIDINSSNIGILEILSFLNKNTKILVQTAIMASPLEHLVKESDFTVLNTVGELQFFLYSLFSNPDKIFFFDLDFSLVELGITISNHENREIVFEITKSDKTINFMLRVFNEILLYDKKESIKLLEKLQKLPDYYVETLSKSADKLNIYKTFDDYLDGKVIKKDK